MPEDFNISIAALDAAHHLHGNTNPSVVLNDGPMVITGGDGIRVIDEHGKHYIEGLAGLWCANLGFSETRLMDAADRQFRQLPFYHSFFARTPDVTSKLAKRLSEITPASINRFFFACSGSEAIDSAIKFVWYYNNAIGRPKKKKIISRLNGYHGVTIAGGSLTRLKIHQDGFDLPIDRFLQVDCPHFYRFALPGESEDEFSTRLAINLEETILAEGPETIAAFFAEPVQASGGVIIPAKGYFEKIQKVLKKYDILFVVDEVICGFGRTGNMFGCETYDIVPDMMTMAKGLSAAYQPISAIGITDEIFTAIAEFGDQKGAFGHGFTYGGHPVAAAVALEAQNIYRDRNIVDHVKKIGAHFQTRLQAFQNHELVGEARGVGLLGAIELVANKTTKEKFDPTLGLGVRIFEITAQNGMLFRFSGDTLLFSPPLILQETDVDEIFDILGDAMNRVLDSI